MKVNKYHFSAGLIISFLIISLPFPSWAGHSWSSYHWARSAHPLALDIGDNVSDVWHPYLAEAITHNDKDWNDWPYESPAVLNLEVVAGGAPNTKRCAPTLGRVEVCNDRYGKNGWLGVAQIWISGGHITQGTAKLNDTYFNTSPYKNPEWRSMVMCQEIGHTFGLDHQDETFGNPNLGSCMDYTNDPAADPSNERPNDHDYEQIGIIYNSHFDSSGALAGSNAALAASRQLGGDSPAEWGMLVRSTNGGLTQIYERELGGGQKIVTFVIWVEDRAREHPR